MFDKMRFTNPEMVPCTFMVILSEKCFGIILEYVGGGELFDFIAIAGKFSEVVTRTYFYQLMNAIHYMHEKGYAHRDIKP